MYRIFNPDEAHHVDRGAQFMRLFLANQPRIYAFVLSLVPRWCDADDIMQETSAVLWAKFGQFEEGTNFTAWAMSVARFQVMSFRKRSQAASARFSDETVDAIAESAAQAEQEIDDRRLALERCLPKLRESDLELIRKRYRPGVTATEVAREIGRSPDAVHKALGRVHRQLLECVRRTLAMESRR
jgi:RNA polymerase sigma-70 factor (ECF subfamily)